MIDLEEIKTGIEKSLEELEKDPKVKNNFKMKKVLEQIVDDTGEDKIEKINTWFCDFCSQGPCRITTRSKKIPLCPYDSLFESRAMKLEDGNPEDIDIESDSEELDESENLEEEFINNRTDSNTETDTNDDSESDINESYGVSVYSGKYILTDYIGEHLNAKQNSDNLKCFECNQALKIYRKRIGMKKYIDQKYDVEKKNGEIRLVHPECKK